MVDKLSSYKEFLITKNVGANDKVADSVTSYISYLNSVEKYLDIEINNETLSTLDDLSFLKKRLLDLNKISTKTIQNYCSAMKQYVHFCQENETTTEQMNDLKNLKIIDLLQLHAEIISELKNRKIVRTNNNPTGDYAEWLVASNLNLQLETNSKAGYDATDSRGFRYQIKSRKLASTSDPKNLSVIRNLDKHDFDYLIAVIFDKNYKLIQAIKVPHIVVHEISNFKSHVNGHEITINDKLLQNQNIEDITHLIKQT